MSRSRLSLNFARRPSRRRVANTLVTGASGAGTTNDRGATQVTGFTSLSPYYNNNFLARYQTYVNLYETSWEVRKIIDIPVDDAMRKPTIREGLSPEDELMIARAWEDLGVERQLRRAMKQERLLGGSVILGVMLLQDGEKLSEPLNQQNLMKGDLKALNVIDLSKLSRSRVTWDPFQPDYDRVDSLNIDGIEVDASRMVVFDGNALFGRNSQRLMQNFRYNPLGFGESKIAPLYDVLCRSLGTQQAAYQLVNMASAIILSVENLRNIKALDSGAEGKLQEVARQLSVYNAALVDGKDVKVESLSASFGSVPELLVTYTQFLAAASDIPITRFLGSSAGGLNATGEGDSRNYYDMVDSIINNTRKPAEQRCLDWIGPSVFGYEEWKRKSANLVLSYEPLWNLDAVQQATRDEIITRAVVSMYQAGFISAETAVNELNAREIYETKLKAEEALLGSDLDTGDLLEGKDAYSSRGFTPAGTTQQTNPS